MSTLIVDEAFAGPSGFSVTVERLISSAAHRILEGGATPMANGVAVEVGERYFDNDLDRFAVATFQMLMNPADNSVKFNHLGTDRQVLSTVTRDLRKVCETLCIGDDPLMSRISWLVRGACRPESKVTLDWARNDFLGAVVWYTANGWLIPTGETVPNSLGGSWPCARITEKGLAYVGAMPAVEIHEDANGRVALDPVGWLIDHSGPAEKHARWIRCSAPPQLQGGRLTAKPSVTTFHTEFGAYPQLG